MATRQTRKKPVATKTQATRAKVRRHIKMAVVPHAANDHRPHLIRRYGIISVLAIVLVAQIMYGAFMSNRILGIEAQLTPTGLLEATNNARNAEGLGRLQLNEKLNEAAQLKLNDMFENQYWAHVSPEGTAPWYWFEQAEYRYSEAGENLAKNFSSSGGVVSAWMVSPTHRANVMKQTYRDVGFAVKTGTLNDKQTTLVVALYGRPETASLVQSATDVDRDTGVLGADLSFMARAGIALQSLTPVMIASLVLLLFVANVALIAHLYRKKMPTAMRKSWRKHHGAYKALFLVAVAALLVAAYGGVGQI